LHLKTRGEIQTPPPLRIPHRPPPQRRHRQGPQARTPRALLDRQRKASPGISLKCHFKISGKTAGKVFSSGWPHDVFFASNPRARSLPRPKCVQLPSTVNHAPMARSRRHWYHDWLVSETPGETPQRMLLGERLRKLDRTKPGMKSFQLVTGLLVAASALTAQQYTISTYAGIPFDRGWFGDGSPANTIPLAFPLSVASDGKGSLYMNDFQGW